MSGPDPAARRAAILQEYHDAVNRCRDRWDADLRRVQRTLRDAARTASAAGKPGERSPDPGHRDGAAAVPPSRGGDAAVAGILSR